MKLNLPTAAQRRKINTLKAEDKKQSLAQLVNVFLNGAIRDAIAEAEGEYVNVQIPSEAYSFGDDFYRECARQLKPLGYASGPSHDGAGMYGTLWVSWEKKVWRTA
jgi:hypothetical protein